MNVSVRGHIVLIEKDGPTKFQGYSYSEKRIAYREHGVNIDETVNVYSDSDFYDADGDRLPGNVGGIDDVSLVAGIVLDARAMRYFLTAEPRTPDVLLGTVFDEYRGEHPIWLEVCPKVWVGITKYDIIENGTLVG